MVLSNNEVINLRELWKSKSLGKNLSMHVTTATERQSLFDRDTDWCNPETVF